MKKFEIVSLKKAIYLSLFFTAIFVGYGTYIHKHFSDITLHEIYLFLVPLLTLLIVYVFANYFVFFYLKRTLSKKNQLLKEAYEKDTLTNLPNKRSLQNFIEQQPPLLLAILDIQRFNTINALYGSEYGDAYLQFAAKKLLDFAPDSTKLYKLDSDAFALLCIQPMELEEYQKKIYHLLKKLSKEKFFYHGYESSLFFVAGIADTSRKSNPLVEAEMALKKAKEERKITAIYSHELDTNTKNKAILDDILYAIEHKKVFAYFQPIYDNSAKKITKYESLMRIEKKDGTIAKPEYFLEVAKKTPHYQELTLLMVEDVLQTICNYPNYHFSINLSSLDIENHTLIESLLKLFEASECTNRLTLEILESEEFKDFENLLAFIQKIKALDMKVSIDDFGSGYSNISNTIKLEIDYLKIDGSLIQNLLDELRYEKVLKSIINFAKEINAKTIAEYVENEALSKRLQELGIDMLQGYFIGKPKPLSS